MTIRHKKGVLLRRPWASPVGSGELAGRRHCPRGTHHPLGSGTRAESPLPLRFLSIWRAMHKPLWLYADCRRVCCAHTHTCAGRNYLLKNVYVYKFFCGLCTVNKLQINHEGARTDKGGVQTERLGHGVSLTWKKMCRFINPETGARGAQNQGQGHSPYCLMEGWQ